MAINSELVEPSSVDLDELLRSLKKGSDPIAPLQGTDQQSSYLPNTHQGNAGTAADSGAGETLPAAPSNTNEFSPTEIAGSVAPSTLTAAPLDDRPVANLVQENASAGTIVATLGAPDVTKGGSFTYALANDPSGKFEVVGNEVRLKAGATIDYETTPTHDLAVTITDAEGLSHTETLTIALADQNEAPTGITITGGSVQENASAGTVVANLGAVDADADESFTYSLTNDPSGKFEIVGNEVRVKAGAAIDYEAAPSHDLTVTVTDAGGLTHTETLSIQVANQSGSFIGTSANNALTGSSEEDTISGLAGNDVLSGLAGNDLLDGGAGNDTMIGGAGNDTYVVDATGDVVTEAAGQGTDTVQSSVSYALGANVENLQLTGSAAINATGNTLANTLTGNSGNNVLSGGAGNDTMIGGAGNDTYVVDATGDVVTELASQGTDTVQSSVSYALGANVENMQLTGSDAINATGNTLNNALTGNAGNNVLDGGAGNDTLSGGAGDDTMSGGSGSDTMTGGVGNDTYVVDATGDRVTELASQGTDTVQSSVSYALGSNVENLQLTGSAAINATGNTFDNTLTGNSGNNTLNGGAGNDTMIGGAGNDTMIGGAGNDMFAYMRGDGSDAVNGGNGASWVDTLQLDQSLGSMQPGTDWTISLTSGNIVSQDANSLVLSNDADGAINFADGSKVDFVDLERVQW